MNFFNIKAKKDEEIEAERSAISSVNGEILYTKEPKVHNKNS